MSDKSNLGPGLFVIGFVILIISAAMSLFTCEALIGPCPEDMKTELPRGTEIIIMTLFLIGAGLVISGFIINKWFSKKIKT